MSRFFSICSVLLFHMAWAVTENVSANALYSPIYDSSIIVKSTIKSFVLVALLIAFWIYWNKVILPNLHGGVIQNRNLQVIEKLQIDPTTAVYVLKIGDAYETIVTSNRQVTRLNTGAIKIPKKSAKTVVPAAVDFSTLLNQLKKSKLLKR